MSPKSTVHDLPTDEELQALLAGIFASGTKSQILVTDRRQLAYASSAAIEVVTMAVEKQERTVLCKYSSRLHPEQGRNHLAIRKEARVYADILAAVDLPSARFHGWREDADRSVLVLEFLESAERLNRTTANDAPLRAAAWIGAFHRISQAWIDSEPASWLPLLDKSYLVHRANEALRAAPDGAGATWAPVVNRYIPAIEILSESDTAVMHGEFYPSNLLVTDGKVVPIDWEAAARGPGVLDLACLVDGWDAETVRACSRSYAAARWPTAGPPDDFDLTLVLARIHMHLHWLGTYSNWEAHPALIRRAEEVKSLVVMAQQLESSS